MPKKTPEWRAFETLLAEIHRKASPGAEVTHNKRIVGRSKRRRQIDIAIESVVGFYKTLIVVECRRYKRTVGIEKVEAFVTKLTDVGGSHGVMISTRGFDKGAVAVAKSHNVTLLTYREATDLDWTGITKPEAWLRILGTSVELEGAEVYPAMGLDVISGTTALCNSDGAEVATVATFANRLVQSAELGRRPEHFMFDAIPEAALHLLVEGRQHNIDFVRVRCRVRAFEYLVNITLASGHVLTNSQTGEPEFTELVSTPWDMQALFAGGPSRELTQAEYDQMASTEKAFAIIKPESMKRYMRVVITKKANTES